MKQLFDETIILFGESTWCHFATLPSSQTDGDSALETGPSGPSWHGGKCQPQILKGRCRNCTRQTPASTEMTRAQSSFLQRRAPHPNQGTFAHRRTIIRVCSKKMIYAHARPLVSRDNLHDLGNLQNRRLLKQCFRIQADASQHGGIGLIAP